MTGELAACALGDVWRAEGWICVKRDADAVTSRRKKNMRCQGVELQLLNSGISIDDCSAVKRLYL